MADATPLLELIDGFRHSQTLFAAVELEIFDGARPEGPGVDRLLDACVSLGLLEHAGGVYSNTALADEYLSRASTRSLAGYIRFASASLYPKWAYLAGSALGKAVPALPQPAQPHAHKDFMDGMQGYGMLSSPRIAGAFDLSRFRTFVDLGGSTGHLALSILERYPAMRVGVFELPEVVESIRAYTGNRADLFAGNFFLDPLPPADLYGLGKVLHNCREIDIPVLLGRIYEALPAGGALLVAERLLDEDARGPVHVHMSSLNMLVASHGRERPFSEYRGFLEQSGFVNVQVRKTGAPVDAILAHK